MCLNQKISCINTGRAPNDLLRLIRLLFVFSLAHTYSSETLVYITFVEKATFFDYVL